MGLCSMLLSLLLLLSSTQVRGGPPSNIQKGLKMGVVEEKVMVERSMIGSRPPRCERRCLSCGHCEPVQVPAVPQDKHGTKNFFKASSSWRDDSNYKPMSWKCKCGDMILNP